ncbi:MAG: aminopeptidase [Deltaproteobacteria bacterium]|nr:aminopeptidase [Deltaproteobacteria bacterium]
MRSRLPWLPLLALVPALLGGCSNLRYYARTVGGQLDISRRAQPIEQVLADPATDPVLRTKLEAVGRIRQFATSELNLPEDGYRTYADLGRPYVLWNVFAAPELSLEPKQWCFPVAGCVNYKGYFSQEDAAAYASSLRSEGYEVYLGGVPAYSTLGWFNDPVLNTFIHYPEPELARLIFHELAHHVAYAKDDCVFNESFATAVERAGLERWLDRNGAAGQRETLEKAEVRRTAFYGLVGEYRERLREVYASARNDEEKRESKGQVLVDLRAAYERLKATWDGYRGYDAWFGDGPNNAQLASISVYTQHVPAFQQLLTSCSGDYPTFFERVRALAKLPKSQREARLRELHEGAEAIRKPEEEGRIAGAKRASRPREPETPD